MQQRRSPSMDRPIAPRSGRCSPIGFIVAQNEAGEL
jgi:hypothetical protein